MIDPEDPDDPNDPDDPDDPNDPDDTLLLLLLLLFSYFFFFFSFCRSVPPEFLRSFFQSSRMTFQRTTITAISSTSTR